MSNSQSPRRRPGGTYTTKSGNSIKVNRSFSDRVRARKDARARQRAVYLSTLPKNRWKRLAFRLHPKRVFHYWFSRQGAIMALKVAGIGVVVCFLLFMGLFAYLRKDLPDITNVSGNSLPGSISYYDSTGKTLLWQDYGSSKRIPVPGNEMSTYMEQATVAIEDKDFYHEGAFNVRGISRAAFHDAFSSGGGLQGGSTITQQLVKLNENWTGDETISRKVKELILAVELAREYTKDQILTGYLNVAPYGGVEYGCESAARDYFNTTCKNLTLAQASMLAAIPQYPSQYSPYSDPKYNPAATANYFDENGLIARQHYVLDQMAQQGMITQAQADAAKQTNVLAEIHPLQTYYQGIKAPYFVLAARQELENKFGSQTYQHGGWKVTTTLNMKLQNEAEMLVADNYTNIQNQTGGAADEEALVGEDVPTGKIVSLVGGVDFKNTSYGQNNYAAGILIPPGSSFKPYDYTTFIENNNAGAGSVLYDSYGPLPGYPCTVNNAYSSTSPGNCLDDYDHASRQPPGPITLRYALGGSRNIPAVKAMLSVIPTSGAAAEQASEPGKISTNEVASINKTIATASAMMDNPGEQTTYNCYSNDALTKTTQCYGASAIGDGAYLYLDDHVNGLSTLARLGVAIPRTFIDSITDASDKTIYQWQQPKGKQVVKKDAAYIVDNMASDPNASYLPENAGGYCSATTCSPFDPGSYSGSGNYKFQRYNGWDVAVKTGTTNNGFDGLMTAWTTKYAVVSWVGNHMRNKDLSAYSGAAMEYLTEPLTRSWIEYALNGQKPVNWQQPSDIKVEPAFIIRNHIHFGDIEPSPSKDVFPSWYNPPNSSSSIAQTIDKVSGGLATSCTPAAAKEYITNSNATTFSVDQFVGTGSHTSVTTSDNVHNCDDSKPTATLRVTSNDNSSNNGQVVCDKQSGCTITVAVSKGTHDLTSSKFPGSVDLIINGKVAKAFTIGSNANPQTFSYAYVPKAAGTVTVVAEVTDSVLYQASSNSEVLSVTTTNDNNPNGGSNTGNGGNGGETNPQARRRGTIPLPPLG